MSFLSFDHVSVHYGGGVALWEVITQVPQGRCVGLIGPNGAGKSTLLKAVVGLVPTLSGTIRIFGKPFHEVRHRIAYIPQRNEADWSFPVTVIDVVLMGRYTSWSFPWITSAERMLACDALEQVGMRHYADTHIDALSEGQKQRVFLARALMQDADVYLMDEPLTGVDASTEQWIEKWLLHLKTIGKSFVLVHHDLSFAKRVCDWFLLLKTSLVSSGPWDEIESHLPEAYGAQPTLLQDTAHALIVAGRGLCRNG